jgi:hypothetical protein
MPIVGDSALGVYTTADSAGTSAGLQQALPRATERRTRMAGSAMKLERKARMATPTCTVRLWQQLEDGVAVVEMSNYLHLL